MKRRKLTPFLAHEMLYDYATDQLDQDRKHAVEEFLKTDRESQTLLANIQNALAYANKLKETKVDPDILVHLREAESAMSLGKKYSSWSEWPEALRWSLTAIGLSALVAGVVAVVPWSRFAQKPQAKTAGVESVEVAQIPQPTSDELEAQNAVADNEGSGDEAPDEASDEGSGDEHDDGDVSPTHVAAAAGAAKVAEPKVPPTPAPTPVPVIAKTTPTPAPTLAPTLTPAPSAVVAAQTPAAPAVATPIVIRYHFTPYFVARVNPFAYWNVSLRYIPAFIVPPNPVSTPEPKVVPVLVAAKEVPKPITPAKQAKATPASSAMPDGDSASGSSEQSDEKPRGFVYRAFMTLPDLEDVGPKITEELLSLGAEKAGEVELGWKRGTGRYYHFAMPAENEKKALEKLQVYGPVRISKDPHPRVMPAGQVRFILWVESAN